MQLQFVGTDDDVGEQSLNEEPAPLEPLWSVERVQFSLDTFAERAGFGPLGPARSDSAHPRFESDDVGLSDVPFGHEGALTTGERVGVERAVEV